jgi:ribonuclease D
MIHATVEQLTIIANLNPKQVKALKEFESQEKQKRRQKKLLYELLDHLDTPL